MATFEITTPDGRVFEVVGKDAQGAAAAVKKMLSSQPQQSGQPQQDDRSLPRAIADVGASFAGAVPKAAGAMVSIGSQVPVLNKVADPIAQSLMNAGEFVDDALLSDYQKNMNADMANAVAKSAIQLGPDATISDHIENMKSQGGAAAKFIMENPSQALMLTSQALPYLVGGGIIGRGVAKLAPSTAGATAGAIGEGSIAAGAVTGDIIAQLEAEGIEGYTPDRLAALPAGVLTAVIGRMGAKVNQKLGGADADTLVAGGGTGAATRGLSPKGAAIGGTTELGEEFLQSAQEQAFTNIGTGDPISDEVGSSAVQGAAAGFGMGSVIGSNVLNAGSRDLTEEQMEQRAVSADVARNIRKVADNNGYSLDDVNPTSGNGARQALEEVRNQQVRDVVNLAKKLKKQLDPRQAETLEQLLMDYSAAEAAIAAGKRKVSTKVTTDQYDAVKRLVTPYKEGNALLQTLLGTNVVTDLFKDGMKGGLSQWTDLFNPLLTSGHSYDPTRVGNVVLGGLPLMTYGIDSIIPQAAIVLGGQAIDKVLGGKGGTRRKLVKRFVKLNEGNDGLGRPTGPSLIAQAQQAERQEEQEAEAARIRKQQNTDAFNQMDGIEFNKSPLGTLYLGTGLNQAGLEALLAHIDQHYSDKPAVSRWIDETRRNLAGEENQIEDINKWIGALNGVLNTDARLDALREDQPDNPLAQRARRRAGFGPSAAQSSAGTAQQQQQPQGPSAAVQSGIDSNRAQLEKLRQGLAANKSLTPAERGRLLTALDELQYNLGSEPAVAAMDVVSRLESDGISESLINRHIMPYVERVLRQQARSGRQQPPTSTGNTDLASDEDFDASKPALTDNVPTGEVSGVPLETYLPRAYDIAKREVYKKGRDLKLAIQKRSLQAQRSSKINLREMTPVNEDRLADFAVADALEALKTNSNAIGWYDKTVSEALSQMAQVFPEIATDPKAKLQFVWALAATSNGTKVDKNLELASIAYEHLQKTGRFPTDIGIGKAAKAIRSGLQMYHTMLDKFNGDHAALEQFSNSQFTVKDLEERYGIPISGEGANETVRGAAVLGPKIGNGFFSNLYGNFDALTIDRWNMRTVGRWRGDLVVINKKMIKKKRDELWSILSSMPDEDMRSLRKLYKGTRTKLSNTVMSDRAIDKWANATAKLSQDPDWRNLINDLGFEEVRKKGNGLFGYLDGQREAPSGPTERAFIRRVFEKALDRLNNNPTVLALPSSNRSNQPLTMSDLQALLWYPEKLLYDTAKKPVGEESKGYKDDEAPDYANAARKFVNNRQANSQRGRLGLTNGTRGRGRGTGTPIDGPNGQPTSFDQEPSAGSLTRPSPSTGRRGDAGNLQTPSRGQGQGALAQQGPAASDADGQSQHPVQQEDLDSLSNATAKDFFARPNWAILTATQENLSDTIKEQRNRENNEELEQKLIKDGIPYIRGTGFYNNEDQGPSFIIVADEATAMAYGKLYSQESILTKDGLVYSLPYPNTPTTGEILSGPEALQKEFYTSTGNLDFYLGLDFAQGPAKPVYKAGYSEAAGRPQLPIRDSDGMVELHHWSDRALTEVDPANAGTGPLNGVERRRGAKLGFFGINVRQNQRDQGTGYVKEGGLGDVEHVGIIDPASLYPINSDPEGLRAGINDISILERLIKDAGYKGYYVEQTGVGSAPLGNVAALFEPLPVTPVTSEQSFDQDAGALTQQPAQQPQQQSSFNMKSLVHKMLGSQPATPDQVKAQLPVVRPVFEIGKKGTKYADGIQDIDAALQLSKALNVSVRLFDSQQEMFDDMGRPLTENAKGIRGAYSELGRTVWGMNAGAQAETLGNVNDLYALTTVLHELGHAAAKDSGFESVIERMMQDNSEYSDSVRKRVYKEIDNIQKNIDLYVEKNPKQRRPVRRIMAALQARKDDPTQTPRVNRFLDYINQADERAVDPVLLYFVNPRLAKAVAPTTSRLIKENINASGNPDLKLHAYPFATIVAVVLAMMLNGRTEEEEEEQQRQQMPAGALSPQAGALSQQQFAA